VQAHVLLAILYVVLVLPVGLIRRFATPGERSTEEPTWRPRVGPSDTDRLQAARRQFE
jgi:hypothetical protein